MKQGNTPKRLLNLHEEATHRRLQKASHAWEARVFPKVRLADVLPIEGSGIANDHYRFALQSHFDFVVTSANLMPEFAVEFDGHTHQEPQQQARDKKKNELCARFGLPLLRVNSNYLSKRFRKWDLLSWFTTCWFCHIEHNKQIEEGVLDAIDDAIFDPRFVLDYPGATTEFPLWLSRGVQGYFRNLFFDRKVVDFCVSHISGEDEYGVYRGLAWIMLDHEHGLVSRTAMQPQQFEIGIREATEEIAIFGLRDAYDEHVSGKRIATSAKSIRLEIDKFHQTHTVRFAFYGGIIKPRQ